MARGGVRNIDHDIIDELTQEIAALRQQLAAEQKRCGTCAYTASPESAGKKWCEKLERFVSLQFGCADWRAKDGAK